MKNKVTRQLLAVGILTMAVSSFAALRTAEAGEDPTRSFWYRSTNWVDKAAPYVQKFNRSRIPFEEFSAGTIPALRGGSRVGEWIGNKVGPKVYDYMYPPQPRR
jgi:hypothetical protein